MSHPECVHPQPSARRIIACRLHDSAGDELRDPQRCPVKPLRVVPASCWEETGAPVTVVYVILVLLAAFFGFLAAKAGAPTTKTELPEVEPEFELDLAAAS